LAFWSGILAYPNVDSKTANTFALDQTLSAGIGTTSTNNRGQPDDVSSWTDAALIAAVRTDPPDEAALDALVERSWPRLFARCQLMTQSREKAADLAQEAWHRILRARHSLKPEGNFQAYLMTVATNLWRDSNRSGRRAGAMADHRLLSLDATFLNDDGETASLGDLLPDSKSVQAEQSKLLEMDIDQALAQLTPLLRDVLLARFVIGESCAEIARRYSRTEQTVSGWVREAIRRVNEFLYQPTRSPS
jgi:RNA polymerase sigma-70 factor (ECF subfamily)